MTVDHALLNTPDAALGDSVQSVLDAIDDELGEVLEEFVDASEFGQAPLLIEVITADFSEARTQVGPGDAVQMDLTAAESLTPGDRVIVSYILGQTLPGDPEIEAELTPMELFAYRWDQGLIRVLSDSEKEGVASCADYSAQVVEGSTRLSREVKEAFLDEFLIRRNQQILEDVPSEQEYIDFVREDLFERDTFGFGTVPDVDRTK